MTTPPEPRRAPDSFIAGHEELDVRLAEAFRRYDVAFRALGAQGPELVAARMDLSLLLWDGQDAPQPVREQLVSDAKDLLRETPPL